MEYCFYASFKLLLFVVTHPGPSPIISIDFRRENMSQFNSAQWIDISSICKEAASQLTDSQPMLAISSFSLLDSMSAVELMDGKMDQCFDVVGEVSRPLLLKYDAESFDKMSKYDIAMLLQSLFVYEVAFLDGASQTETIAHCIPMWKESWAELSAVDRFTERTVLGFCKGLSRSLNHIYTGVLAADIFEDEDFQSSYREHLLQADEDESIADLLIDSIRQLVVDDDGIEADDATVTVAQYVACQLRCRLALLNLYRELGAWIHGTVSKYARLMREKLSSPPPPTAEVDAEGNLKASAGDAQESTALQEASAHLRTTAKSAQLAVKRMRACHEQYLQQQATASSDSSAANGSIGDIRCHSEYPAISFAFNAKLPKLVQVSPVRHVCLRVFSESMAYLENICDEVLRVCTTADCLFSASAVAPLPLDELIRVSVAMSESRMHVLPRSLYLAVLHALSMNLVPMLQQCMAGHGLPNSVVQSELVERQWLGGNPSAAAWEHLKALCCSRNVLSVKMEAVLSLWGTVSAEAQFVDEQFRALHDIPDSPPWCTPWGLVMTTAAMDLQLSLLVETEVVGPTEVDYLFWYWDFACTSRMFAMDQLRSQRYDLDVAVHKAAAERAQAVAKSSKTTGTSKKKHKKDASTASDTAVGPPPSPRPYSIDYMYSAGRGQLCRGLFRTCVVAGQTGLLDKTENKYMSWDARFDLRFRAFRNVANPPILAHSDFNKTVGRSVGPNGEVISNVPADPHAVLSGATVCFQNARKYLDEIRKVAPNPRCPSDVHTQDRALVLTKVAVANSLSVLKTTQLLPKKLAPTAGAVDGTEIASCLLGRKFAANQSYDKHFPVFEVLAPAV